MASDNLLRVSGPGSGNHVQATAITANGDLIGSNPAVNLGPNKVCQAQARIGGAFTAGGSLAIQIYECDNQAGANPALIAATSAMLRTNVGDPSSATPAVQYPVPPVVVTFATGARGYVKATAAVVGTTSAAGVSVVLSPQAGAVVKSGG